MRPRLHLARGRPARARDHNHAFPGPPTCRVIMTNYTARSVGHANGDFIAPGRFYRCLYLMPHRYHACCRAMEASVIACYFPHRYYQPAFGAFYFRTPLALTPHRRPRGRNRNCRRWRRRKIVARAGIVNTCGIGGKPAHNGGNTHQQPQAPVGSLLHVHVSAIGAQSTLKRQHGAARRPTYATSTA